MEKADVQYQRMTETPIARLVTVLAIPTVISMLVTMFYNMADTYFVGTIGTSATGACGVVIGLMAILQAFGFMYGHGAGSHISRQLGAKEIEKARVYASTSLFYAVVSGLVICVAGMLFMDPLMRLLGSTETILPYARIYALYILLAAPAMTSSCVMNNILRYEGKAFFAMIGLTSGGILNIFGDAFLILGCHMGIEGAGISTMISQYISVLILYIPYLRGRTQSVFRWQYVARHSQILLNIIATGMPSMVRQTLNSISTIAINACAKPYGDAAIAGMAVANQVIMFLFCVCIGIGQGLQPVSAFNYGAKKYSRVRSAFFFVLTTGTIALSIIGLCGYLFAPVIIRQFRDDPNVIEVGVAALRWQCLSMCVMPCSAFGNMLFQSIGKSRIATFLASLRSGLALLPVLVILTMIWGLQGLEMSRFFAEVITTIVTIPFLIGFFRSLPKEDEYA